MLGDETVSYDPITNTLTLNGYKYEGSGFVYDDWNYGILALPDFMDTLTIALEGENEITLTEDADAIFINYTNAIIKGDGSLLIDAAAEEKELFGIYS